MATRRGKQQESFDVLARIRFSNAIITYHSHRNVRSVTYRSATKKMTNRRGKQQDSFQWSDDEVELLLTLTSVRSINFRFDSLALSLIPDAVD